jgi:NAD(P)-dependent dehydrogenase (short-subunit alcohol dehydrogenase family)
MNTTSKNILTLEGKDIWVFGGAGYLGQASVLLLRAAGATVLCADLGDKAKKFVEHAGIAPEVTAATLDVRDGQAMESFIAGQLRERGVPHGVVNMTYAATGKNLEELTEQDFDESNHGGITSAFLLARATGTAMAKEGRGSIVLFSSMYGMVSPDPKNYEAPMNKNPIEYGVNKAGAIQMARYMAVHWGRNNVRCNSISPGPFTHPGTQQEHPGFIERLSNRVPLGRIGKAEEIAGAVAFLVSDASTFITGQNLPVDGGWTSW